jgi:hypothetical protein
MTPFFLAASAAKEGISADSSFMPLRMYVPLPA